MGSNDLGQHLLDKEIVMGVTVALWLFLKPQGELDDGKGSVSADHLRLLADDLHLRLHWNATALTKLHQDGWTGTLREHDIACQHPDVTTEEEALRRLHDLEIDQRFVTIEVCKDHRQEAQVALA
jgi:hypothetical protein